MKYLKTFENHNSSIFGNYTFQHRSNRDNVEDLKNHLISKNNSELYLFLSSEYFPYVNNNPHTFLCTLDLRKDEIFNIYDKDTTKWLTNKMGLDIELEDSFLKYDSEIREILRNNAEKFLSMITASYDEIVELAEDDSIIITNKEDALLYFLRTFGNSWILLETDEFQKIINDNGYIAFTTSEGDMLNIAVRDYSRINVIKKKGA